METTFATEIAAQCQTLSGNLAADLGTNPRVDCQQIVGINGAHANFSITCPNGGCAGRWAGGLHIESAIGPDGIPYYWGHNDPASPYIGQSFNWSTLNWWNLFVHVGVDVVGGNTIVPVVTTTINWPEWPAYACNHVGQ